MQFRYIFQASLLCSLTFNSASAQVQRKEVIVFAGDKLMLDSTVNTYVRDTLIDRFAGKWVGTNADTCIVLEFEKKKVNMGTDEKKLEVDMLSGGCILWINEKEVFNSMHTTPLKGSSRGEKNMLYFSFLDNSTDFNTWVHMRLIDPQTAIFERNYKIGWEDTSDPNLRLPERIEMKKKE